MPVRFKGLTEYKRNFKPIQSYKSASFSPSVEQKSRTAGRPIGSPTHTFDTMEPAIQRKKRVAAPVTSLSSEFFDGSSPRPVDEYMLLGNNDKFCENIKYRNRNTNNPKNVEAFNFRDASPPKIQKIKLHTEPVVTVENKTKSTATGTKKTETMSKSRGTSERDTVSTGVNIDEFIQTEIVDQPNGTPEQKSPTKKNKDQAPAVDTSKFKMPLKRPSNPSKRKVLLAEKAPANAKPEAETEVSPNYVMKYKAGVAAPRRQGPMRQSEYQREFEWKKANRPSPLLNADKTKDCIQTVPVIETPAAKPDLKETTPEQSKPKVTADEQVKKPIIRQPVPVPEPNLDLNQKAAIIPQRPLVPSRMSEYQREFEWKKDGRPSPLLKAEKAKDATEPVVTTPPGKAAVRQSVEHSKSKSSERKFTKEQFSKNASSKPQPSKSQNSKLQSSNSQTSKSQYSKPDSSKPQAVPKSDIKHKPQAHQSPSKPKPPRLSEYQMAFKWNNGLKSSYPVKTDQGAPEEEDMMGEWLKNVIELRRKAEEYRSRSQGTHFSREHLVQLMAQQNELWDMSPLSSEAVDSQRNVADVEEWLEEVDREKGFGEQAMSPTQENENLRPAKNTRPQPSMEVAKKLLARARRNENKAGRAVTEEPDTESQQLTPSTVSRSAGSTSSNRKPKTGQTKGSGKNGEKAGKPVKAAWVEEKKTNGQKPMSKAVDEWDDDEGRIPTPTLRTRSLTEVVRRHHLDRTTPAVGGALLTSVSSPDICVASSVESDVQSSNTLVDEEINKPTTPLLKDPLPVNKTFDVRSKKNGQTFGKPSYDSHMLRDDFASDDRPLYTRYVDTPLKRSDFHLASDTPTSVKDHPRPSFVPPTLQEGIGMTYNKPDNSNNKSRQRPFSWSLQGGQFVPHCSHDGGDDDILSISARSIASSSSLASAVLERARKRQQNVWG